MTAVAETAAALREKAADLLAQAEELENPVVRLTPLGPDQVVVNRHELFIVLDCIQVHPGHARAIAACNSVASALNPTLSPSTEGATSCEVAVPLIVASSNLFMFVASFDHASNVVLLDVIPWP